MTHRGSRESKRLRAYHFQWFANVRLVMFPLVSLSSRVAEGDLGVPTKRNPARPFIAHKPNLMTYGQMAISPYVIKSKAYPKDAAAFLDDPNPA
jgi:hypothetical protein